MSLCAASLAADSCSRPQLVATHFMHDNQKDRLAGLNFPGCSFPSLAWFIVERLVRMEAFRTRPLSATLRAQLFQPLSAVCAPSL